MIPKKVGVAYPVKFTYNHVRFDKNGWADAKKYLPADFDLVQMKVLRDGRERTYNGWINGEKWEAVRQRERDEVLFWKQNTEEEIV